MKKYSIPADFNINNIAYLNELNEEFPSSKIVEVFGQLTENRLNSGRSIDVLPKVNWSLLEKYVYFLNSNSIDFNFTFNSSCMSNEEFFIENIDKIKVFVRNLLQIGINKMTIALPQLIELVKSVDEKIQIKASAICEINSVYKAKFYKKIGANRIVVDPDITRNFKLLRNIVEAFGEGVEIIVTNACMRNCPYKMFHYNYSAHKNVIATREEIDDYYDNRCFQQYASDKSASLKLNWVRPEDVQLYYKLGIQNFKIDGRQHILKGDYIKTIKYYFKEKYDGNLFELIHFFANDQMPFRYIENRNLDGFITPFYENENFCSENCDECGYCEMIAKNDKGLLKAAKTSKMMYYQVRESDSFNKAIQQEMNYE